MCACASAHAMPSGSGWPRSAMRTCLPLRGGERLGERARAIGRYAAQGAGRRRDGFAHGHEGIVARFRLDRSRRQPPARPHRALEPARRTDRLGPGAQGRPPLVAHRRSPCALDRGARVRGALACALMLALPPLVWVVERRRSARRNAARARPGNLPVHRLGRLRRGEGLPRRPRRERAADAPRPPRRSSRSAGADEHRFRVLDLAVTGATFAFVGRVPARGPAPRARVTVDRARRLGARGVGRAQRAVPALHLLGPRAARELLRLVHASEPRAPARRAGADAAARRGGRGPRLLLGVAGALSVDRRGSASRRSRSSRSCSSSTLARRRRGARVASREPARRRSLGGRRRRGARPARATSSSTATCGAFVRIQFVDVPAMYRFIWPRTPRDILALPGDAPTIASRSSRAPSSSA